MKLLPSRWPWHCSWFLSSPEVLDHQKIVEYQIQPFLLIFRLIHLQTISFPNSETSEKHLENDNSNIFFQLDREADYYGGEAMRRAIDIQIQVLQNQCKSEKMRFFKILIVLSTTSPTAPTRSLRWTSGWRWGGSGRRTTNARTSGEINHVTK